MQRFDEIVDKGVIMDLRKERTKRSIINAFIELRSKKTIEKITIKELSELAYINKATFYSHYDDIYDLSEQLETETIDMLLSNIPHPEELITNPRRAFEELAMAFLSQSHLIDILFSGSRASVFVSKLENRLKTRIYTIHPEYKNNLERDIMLTYLIQGSFHTFLANYKHVDTARLIQIAGTISERMLR